MTLTSFEPVCEGLLRIEWFADGWHLWVRHRHYSGLFCDCPPAEYHRLTTTELAEVLDATVMLWGPAGSDERLY